ncbi:MAG: hypothetical protein HY906_21085 [Deltaproteobacteria bacterium]|nr:hypothetical protein [Deltaproteobacteria bacterium]
MATRLNHRPLAPAAAAQPLPAWVGKTVAYAVVISLSFVLCYVTDYNWPTRSGNLSILLFVAANTYIAANHLRKRFRFRGVQLYYTWLLRWHCYLNTAGFVAACFHCYTTSWANNWLWLSLVLMGVLTVGGFLMRFRYPPKVRKGLYVLHTQQVAFLLLLYSLLKGHYVFLWLP